MQTTNFFNVGDKSKGGESIYQEGVHYKVWKDGLGTEVKIANLENEDLCSRTGIIELIPMRMSSRHENRVGIRTVIDRKMGVIWGIPTGVNPETKKLEFLKINLVDSETFDLTDADQAMKWAIIKNSYFVEGSPNLKGKPKYKVRDVERQAKLFLANRSQKRKAIDIAEGLYGQALHDMARMLGIPPEANSDATLAMEVIKRAEDKPKEFMEIHDSPTRKEIIVLKRAMAAGLVSQDPSLGWNYNGLPLGPNEVMAAEYLKEYPQVCQTLDLMTKKVDADTEKSMSNPVTVNPIIDDKDARIARLEAELAEKESIIKNVVAEKLVGDVDERIEWLNEAKRLGVKGAHLIKDLESLKTKVLEKNPDFLQDL